MIISCGCTAPNGENLEVCWEGRSQYLTGLIDILVYKVYAYIRNVFISLVIKSRVSYILWEERTDNYPA